MMILNTYCYTFLPHFAVTVGAAAINATYSSPEGLNNHGDPNLLCTPASWTDIVIFFLGNYVAHAATVPSLSGESKFNFILNNISALLFPAYGLTRGVILIMTFAVFGENELEKALRAQALFMVVRSKNWRPRSGENIKHSILSANLSSLSGTAGQETRPLNVCVYDAPWMTNIIGLGNTSAFQCSVEELHGGDSNNNLPPGYKYAPAPKEAAVEALPANQTTCNIFSNYNLLKSMLALGQAMYAITTLYQAPGDQISQYGYVAFSLTVAPYATMSIINLIAALFCPYYPEKYLVETSVLAEARNRGGKFHGVVGRLCEADATFDRLGNDPALHPVRGVIFRQSTGKNSALQVDLNITKSKVQLPSAKTTSLVEEASVQANPPSVRLENLNHYTTFELLEMRTDFGAPDDSILLIPACSPFKGSKTAGEATEFFVETAEWNQSEEIWDVDFKGFVGSSTLRGWIGYFLTLLLAGIPFAIIGGLSRYQYGKSTFSQRVWITTWLSLGQGYSIATVLLQIPLWQLRRCMPAEWAQGIYEILRLLLFGVPSVGGFVVVAQMLKAYGTCSTIS